MGRFFYAVYFARYARWLRLRAKRKMKQKIEGAIPFDSIYITIFAPIFQDL